MRFTNVFSGRPQPWDRNATVPFALSTSQVAIAPHAATQRWTYTVPSNRKALIMSAHAMSYRITVATTVGQVQGLVARPSTTYTYIAEANYLNNAIGAQDRSDIGSGMVMLASDQLIGQDFDTSAAGTCSFEESAGVLEFDA